MSSIESLGVEPDHLRQFYAYIREARQWARLRPDLLRNDDIRYWVTRLDTFTDEQTTPQKESASFLTGGGEMATRIREFDWSRTSLGPLAYWPQSLRTAVNLMLNSQHPMWVGWGPQMPFLYNDAYLAVLGLAKHPWALGRPAAEVWAEIWGFCGPLADKVFEKGEPSFVDDVLLFMNRGDFLEEGYYSFSYSPIRDELGAVGGLFCPSAEITPKVLNARRLATLAELAANALLEKTVAAAYASAFTILAKNRADVPFALFYMIDPAAGTARLAEFTDDVDVAWRPSEISLRPGHATTLWPVAEVARTGRAQVIPLTQMTGLPLGLANQRISQAMVLPVARGEDQPLGVLISGVNPARRIDTEYRTFFELIAGQLATAIQSARAAEEDKQRAEALAEIDRAKTAFFSNVSHELRTPLTLMLGPIEDILNKPSGMVMPENRNLAELAHRNGLRLLKLVNTLLDFSRIEAGRVEAAYEPADLTALTTDLASVFRAAMEKAGLRFTVDCAPLGEPAYVDREMWEKIVFNLLSNALKFTFEGEIAVRLRKEGRAARLSVSDTGTGIRATELPHIFERFHRVRGAQSRTHEGTGIGLALVRELTRLHGGEASVESEEGRGSNFTITIPLGSAHLPAARIGATRNLTSTRSNSEAFVDEALRWLPDASRPATVRPADTGTSAKGAASIGNVLPDWRKEGSIPSAGRIVLADDNADMRDYVLSLLAPHGYEVMAVPDGEAALEAVRTRATDLVLSDVMMPRLDGFELVRALRSDATTSSIPIILLSARAGDEARVEGASKGADDYLTKPFNARELLARVATHIELARVRKAAAAEVQAREERYRAFVANSSEGIWRLELNPPLDTSLSVAEQVDRAFRDGRFAECNDAMAKMYGLAHAEDLIGKSLDFMMPQSDKSTRDFIASVIREGYRVTDSESVERDASGRTVHFANSMVGFVEDGMLKRMWGTQRDITERKRMEEALRESEERFRAAVGAVSSLIWTNNAAGMMEGEQPGWGNFTGQTRAEYEGYGWSNAVHPEDAQPTIDAWKSAVARRETFIFQHRLRRHDGEWRLCSIRAVPVLNAEGEVREWVGVHTDITERQEAENAIRASEAFNRSILESSHDCIKVLDRQARLLSMSPIGMRMLAIDDITPFLGQSWIDFWQPEDQISARSAVDAALAGGVGAFVGFIQTLAGEPKWFDVAVSPIRNARGEIERLLSVSRDVTERKDAEVQLRRSHDTFLGLIENAPFGIYLVDAELRLAQASAAVRKVFQKASPLIGRDLEEVLRIAWPEPLASQSLACLLRVMKTGESAASSASAERPEERAEMESYDWRIERVTLPDGQFGAVVYFYDMTEHRRAGEALRESEERFRTLADDAPMYIFMADENANISYVNRTFLNFVGLTDTNEFTGHVWEQLLHPEDVAGVLEVYRAAGPVRRPFTVECRYREAATGDYCWILFEATPRFVGGKFAGFIGTGFNIHDRKIAEENLRAAKERAESASRAKDSFLAQLSHELRTPLTPVLMTAAALREDDELPEAVREQLAMIERNVALEARLIDDLLDLTRITRITRGKLALRAEPCDAHSLIGLAVEIVRDEAREKQIKLTLGLNAACSHLIGDPARLQQVFWNILRNAVKFTPQGGHVSIHSHDGDCERKPTDHSLCIEFSDNGIGFEIDEAERLFEPFHQAAIGHGAGLGLGLAIARAVVDLHHGRIHATSPGPGRGATFTVELPATVSNLAEAGGPTTRRRLGVAEENPHEPPMRLLVVEDHEPTLQVLSRLLSRAGHRVTTASSVASAIEIAATQRFDAVISDLGLPDGTGIELMETLRAKHGLSGIALSGYGMEEDLRRTEQVGFIAHLVKPVDVNELRRVLRRIPELNPAW